MRAVHSCKCWFVTILANITDFVDLESHPARRKKNELVNKRRMYIAVFGCYSTVALLLKCPLGLA